MYPEACGKSGRGKENGNREKEGRVKQNGRKEETNGREDKEKMGGKGRIEGVRR